MTAPLDVATDEMVAVAWCKAVITEAAATILPDVAAWSDTGFVQWSTVGGNVNIDTPLHTPVVTADCWAGKTDSDRPKWGQASALAAAVYRASIDQRAQVRSLQLPRGITVRLQSVWPLNHPRRINSDPARFARYSLDIAFAWTDA